MKLRPGLGIRRADRGQHRDASLHRARKGRAQPAAFRFRPAKPVQNHQFRVLIGRAVEQRHEFGNALGVEFGSLPPAIRGPAIS